MKVKTNFKAMHLVDNFLYNRISSSSQIFNNLSTNVKVQDATIPNQDKETKKKEISHPHLSQDNSPLNKDENDKKNASPSVKRINQTENHEVPRFSNIQPPRLSTYVPVESENMIANNNNNGPQPRPGKTLPSPPTHTHPLPAETCMDIDSDPNYQASNSPFQPPATIQSIAQGTHPPREHMQNPPNQLREQVYPPSQPVDNTEQLQANPHQKREIKEQVYPHTLPTSPMDITEQEQHQLPPRESREVNLPSTQTAIEIQSRDSNCMECTESTPMPYRKYIETGAIPKTKKKYETLYTCTLCNTDFKKRKGLERHMKNMHDAYFQKEKGIKRKKTQSPEIRKRMKKSYEANYSCTLCNTDFKARKSLERHIKNMHDAYSQKDKGKKRKNENEHDLRKRIKRNYSYYLEN